MNKGDIIEIMIIDMSGEGNGIGKYDNIVVFVEGAIVGDVVKAEITKAKKKFMLAKTIEIVKASQYRIEGNGKKETEGNLINVSYEAQLMLKEKQVYDKLTRLAKLDDPKVRPIIAMECPYNYRNKTTFAVKGKNVGFYKPGSNSVVYNRETSRIQSGTAMAVAEVMRRFIREDNIKDGLFESVTVKLAEGTGEVMVVLNINTKGVPNGEKLVTLIDDAIYDLNEETYLTSVIVINHKDEINVLAGTKTITDTIDDLSFEISAKAFYQVNTEQMIKLYDKVKEYADLTGEENVYDLYCGVGTIGLTLAKDAKYVVGIESVKDAVLDANRNATINGIVNAIYKKGKAEEVLPDLIKERPCDVAILDPPRSGCDEKLLNTIAEAKIKKIVYVSCDPATLARDIKILTDKGYEFKEATPVDMFPHTMHVETVCLLSRK